MRHWLQLLLIGSLGAFSIASADRAVAGAKNLMQGVPTPDQLIEALSPAPQWRSITATPMTELEQRPAADLAITFGFNSASLTPTGQKILDNLAAGLTSDLDAYKFELEGHTDATGSEPYNQALSERRAQAVRDYLVQQHHVDPGRLVAVGKGETEPLDPADPNAPDNRRVRVINLGASS